MSDIYQYTNYRTFLAAFSQEQKASGVSFRTLAKRCRFKSPDYLQAIIKGKRNLTPKTARKLTEALGLEADAARYFLHMVDYDQEDDGKRRLELLGELRKLIFKRRSTKSTDASIFSNWLYSVLLELSLFPGFKLTVDNIFERLSGTTTRAHIESAMDFLIKRKYLVETDEVGIFKRPSVSYDTPNDVRNIDLQQHHLRFMEMAKHRLNDDVLEREFQCLTVAVSRSALKEIKRKIREFMDELNRELSADEPKEEVLQIQFQAFKIVR